MSGTDGRGYVSGNGQVTELPPEDRDEPVDLTGEDLDGKAVDLADLRGKPAVVNVWWSDCPPCRAEMPDLLGAAQDLDGDAQFLGINIRDNSVEKAQLFAEKYDVPWTSLYDPSGRALLPFNGRLSPRSIPSTLVLDSEGRVAALVLGPIPSKQTLVDLVEAADG